MTHHPRGGGRCQDAPESTLVASTAVFPLKTTTETCKQSERAFQAQVIAYARLMGWRVRHDAATNAPRACRHCKAPLRLPRNEAGFLDLLLIRRPRIVWAELKSERGRLTEAQRAEIAELRSCGQEAHLWRPSDWREIERILR